MCLSGRRERRRQDHDCRRDGAGERHPGARRGGVGHHLRRGARERVRIDERLTKRLTMIDVQEHRRQWFH